MKETTLFNCTSCGAQSQKWSGRCFECGKWGTLEENSNFQDTKSKQKTINIKAAKTKSFADVAGSAVPRLTTNIAEVDRVLGGGIVPGSLILLGGEPGIGKSTLILQIAQGISKPHLHPLLKGEEIPLSSEERAGVRWNNCILYCSGEESAEQIKMRMDRLAISGNAIAFCAETDVDTIAATIREQKPALAIIDSIQTMYSGDVESEAGSVAQVRAITVRLLETAKETGVPVVLIGHVTKEGAVAGPKTLEHLVDTVLYLEGERSHLFRLLRTVKNRFGSVDEVGVFEMREKGLAEVQNPAQIFLAEGHDAIAGTAITIAMEGSRPFFVEIQALVTKTHFGFPQRRADGFDTNRLQLLIAVLTQRAKLPLGQYDVYVNVAGGFTISEPAADLAIALAIASALSGNALPPKTVVWGEVGLSGEVRKVPFDEKRRAEAKRFGYTNIIAPPKTKKILDALSIT